MSHRVKFVLHALSFALVALGSGRTAHAQHGDSWVRLFEAANGQYSSYLDTDSFEQVGEADWAVWVRMVYAEDRRDGFLSPSYRSEQRRYIAKCKARQLATTQRTISSQDGSPVKQESWPESKWEYRAIGPKGGSNYAEFEAICGLATLPLRRLDWSRRGNWRQIGPAVQVDIASMQVLQNLVFFRTQIEFSDGMRVRDKRRVASIAYSVANCESKTAAAYSTASIGEGSAVLDSNVIPLNELQFSAVAPGSPNATVLEAVCTKSNEARGDSTSAAAGRSSGTAVAVSDSGHWLTNAHVATGCKTISISTFEKTKLSVSVLALDSANDLALLKSSVFAARVASFRDSSITVGESIYAFGFPLAGTLASGGVFTNGIVNAVAGLGDDTRLLQISAPIQPGNSGGPLLDSSGSLVGIIVSKLNAVAVFKITGDVPQNVNFAIKHSVAQAFLEAHGVRIARRSSANQIPATALAEAARATSGYVECER